VRANRWKRHFPLSTLKFQSLIYASTASRQLAMIPATGAHLVRAIAKVEELALEGIRRSIGKNLVEMARIGVPRLAV
jgi:hypothetical protein